MIESKGMSKIKILSQDLINKIAAGEVVEQPASVVKELIDNAYDAGASQITVDIEDGGIKKIHVVDNGSGMDENDAELAFKAHATSKIESESDLFNIKNYGFRGEALSSIAAVSKVTLKTRRQDADLGVEIKFEGGEMKSKTQSGMQSGTSIMVEDLFFNIPARRQFLKSPQSEYKSILEIVNAYAIANSEIGITLINNGKVIYSFPKGHQIEDRIREIMGNDVYEKLTPVYYEHPHVEIYGFTGKPEIASERRKNQYLFVNKRIITNKALSFAVKSSYGSLIPQNTNPPYIILIDVAPNIVDVNVHPRKEEVKFSNESLIFEAVKASVKKALDKIDLTPGSDNNKNDFSNSPFGGFTNFQSPVNPQVGANTQRSNPIFPPSQSPKAQTNSPFKSQNPFGNKDFNQSSYADTFWDRSSDILKDASNPINITPQKPIQLLKIHNLYLVRESENGILIYDQHAVHERILYEKLIKKHSDEKNVSFTQKLLTPIIINLSVQETATIIENLDTLKNIGFEIEEFGPNTYKVTQIPVVMANLNIKDLLHEIIGDLIDEDSKINTEIDSQTNKIITYLSCRMAYKAGDNIPLEEANQLISDLDKTEIKYTCPHGRPVKIELTLKELSKMFKRT